MAYFALLSCKFLLITTNVSIQRTTVPIRLQNDTNLKKPSADTLSLPKGMWSALGRLTGDEICGANILFVLTWNFFTEFPIVSTNTHTLSRKTNVFRAEIETAQFHL